MIGLALCPLTREFTIGRRVKPGVSQHPPRPNLMQGFEMGAGRDEMNHMTWKDSCVVASPGRSVTVNPQGERRDVPRCCA